MHIDARYLLPILVAIPAMFAGICLILRKSTAILNCCVAGVVILALPACAAITMAFRQGEIFAAGNWLMLDPLSAYHMIVMIIVFAVSAFFGRGYFAEEIEINEFTLKQARRYGSLWFGSLAAMMLVLVSNNLGVMWVGIEATTLLTAFLICIHMTPQAIEAMWKYLIMCSVGVAAAFTGILLTAASTGRSGIYSTDALLWTNLIASASSLDPVLVQAAFIFIAVGYGTKAGFAPMHNWLPDAHSQAPSPVSAIFSGFLLNAAMYCILRFLPLVESVTGHSGWGRGILVAFGLLSILVAAVFIIGQRDVKRLLAYSSVEHIGVIALGFGLGGVGTYAALLHIFNHSLCKSFTFCCAGRVGQVFGTNEMRKTTNILRTVPVWGYGLTGGILVLIGVAPFAIFLTEFIVLKAALDVSGYWIAGIYLAGLAVVFVGALRHAIMMAWQPFDGMNPCAPSSISIRDVMMVALPLVILLSLGVWIPAPVDSMIMRVAAVLGGLP